MTSRRRCRVDRCLEEARHMRLNRREWLRLLASVPVALRPARLAEARRYRVGVGCSPHPYVATRRALQASGEWPSVAGKVVVIKPNLVAAGAPSTGVATDPLVVCALVDQALADGAPEVLIVEAGPQGANFTACGYDFFASYDSLARVRLVDMTYEAFSLVPVPNGLVYSAIYTPDVLVRPDTVFISAEAQDPWRCCGVAGDEEPLRQSSGGSLPLAAAGRSLCDARPRRPSDRRRS